MDAFCYLIVIGILFAAKADRTSNSDEWVGDIIQGVADLDRNDFIRYHLYKGHELVNKQEKGHYPSFDVLDDEKSMRLYKYFSRHKPISDSILARSLRNVICWEEGCVDISDPAVHPK